MFFGLVGHKWSPNQIRHLVAEKVQELAGIEAVVATHGHADAKTARRYAKANVKLAVETLSKIG